MGARMAGKERTRTIALEYPFEWDGKSIEQVTIHRPKGRDLRAISAAQGENAGTFENGAMMLELLSDLPAGSVDELDVSDFNALSEAIGDFFPRPQQATGAASAPTAPTS